LQNRSAENKFLNTKKKGKQQRAIKLMLPSHSIMKLGADFYVSNAVADISLSLAYEAMLKAVLHWQLS